MQYDHNSERFSFEVTRLVEGHDLTLCNRVEVHYVNTDTNRKNSSAGVYEIDDLVLTDDDHIVFTWLISENATINAGSLSFLIIFKCIESGEITYRWSTDVNNSITIAKGMSNDESVVETYPDILSQWKDDLFAAVYGYKTVSVGPNEPDTYPYIWYDTSQGVGTDVGFITVKDSSGQKHVLYPATKAAGMEGLLELLKTVKPEEIGAAAEGHTHTLEELGAAAEEHTHTLEELGAAAEEHTHTADEVEGLTDKQDKPIVATGLSVQTSAFASDSTYADYPYRASIAIEGVTSTMIPEVIFSLSDAATGVLAPVANSYDGGVYIYATSIPSSNVSVTRVIVEKVV